MQNQTFAETRMEQQVLLWKVKDISILQDENKNSLEGPDFIMPTQPETKWKTSLDYDFNTCFSYVFRAHALNTDRLLQCEIKYDLLVGKEENDLKPDDSDSLKKGSKPCIKVYGSIYEDKTPKNKLADLKNFILKCSFTVISTSTVCNVSSLSTSPENDINCLLDNFKTLYLSKKLSDFNIVVEGKSLPVHKCILYSQSPVFAAMFENDTLEKSGNELVIKDFKIKTMELLLLFVYTGQFSELSTDEYFLLYSAADKYALVSLKEILAKKLINFIGLDNVCDVYTLGHFHSDATLKSAAIVYIKQNASSFLLSENWRNLLLQNSKIAAQMIDEA